MENNEADMSSRKTKSKRTASSSSKDDPLKSHRSALTALVRHLSKVEKGEADIQDYEWRRWYEAKVAVDVYRLRRTALSRQSKD